MTEIAARNLKLLNILAFLNSFRAYEGVLAVYFATVTGSYMMGMTALAVMNISSCIFEIPTGVFSDYIGRKKTIIITILVAILVSLCFFSATPLLIFVGVILNGFSMAMRSGSVSAYIYENLELLGRETEFQKEEGARLAMGRYGLVIAGILGTVIILFFSIKAAILITVVASFFALILSFALREVNVSNPQTSNMYAHVSEAWKSFMKDPFLKNISIGRIIARGGGNIEYRFRSLLYALYMPEWLVNFLGIINNFVSGLTMQYAHKIVRFFGLRKACIDIEIIDRGVTTVGALIQHAWAAFPMNIVTSIAFGLREVAAGDLLQQRYGKDQRATMGSFIGLGSSLVYGILGIFIGFLADGIGILNTMLLIQPILLTSVFFMHRGIKHISTNS